MIGTQRAGALASRLGLFGKPLEMPAVGKRSWKCARDGRLAAWPYCSPRTQSATIS